MNILTALSWGFGTLTTLTGLFIFLCGRSEVDDPDFQSRFGRAFESQTNSEVGARMAGAFFAAHDQPLRLRWKLFWCFLVLTGLSIGGLQFI